VLGAVTHRQVMPMRETLTSKLFEATEGDVLLAKSARHRQAAAVAPSVRQQILHQAEEFV
jgi:hypothetical protein